MISFDIDKSGSSSAPRPQPNPRTNPVYSNLERSPICCSFFDWVVHDKEKLLIPTWLVFNHLSPYRTRCYRRSLNPIFYFRLNFYIRESKIKLTLTCEPDEVTDNWCNFGLCDTDFCHWTTMLLQVDNVTSYFSNILGCIIFSAERRRNEIRWYEIYIKTL